jgi:hypothetical protein
MQVRRLCWLGIRTDDYEPMVRFLRDVLELTVEFEEETTAELSLASGERVQVFAPGHPNYDLFATGPVPLFEVDDVHAARG